MDNIPLWCHINDIFIDVLNQIFFWLAWSRNISDDLLIKWDANLWKHFNQRNHLLMIQISLSHLFPVSDWAFIFDDLIQNYYVFTQISNTLAFWNSSLILKKSKNSISLIELNLLSLESYFLCNRPDFSSIERSRAFLNKIVFSEAFLLRKMHDVCDLPVLCRSLVYNDVSIDKLIFIFFWLGLNYIL